VFKKIGVMFGIAFFMFFFVYGCDIIEPGHVGIKVNLYGEKKGVQDYTLRSGAVWYNRFSDQVYEFPTFMQNAVWTKASDEGSPTDESVTFNSSEGAVVNTDVALSYQIQAEKVPSIFVELRQDADYITHTYMRGKTRDAINRIASSMKVTDIFGEGKQRLLIEAKKELDRELGHKGFVIDMIAFVGEMRVDPKVEDSINMTISASQKAIEAQNKVVQSKAEADQKIEEARGEAESITLVAKAKADANRILTESLSDSLLRYEALQRWDGILPRVTGDSIPFIDVTSEVKSVKESK
jgi:regulator of protease activity HflC (stomatin/prohibitin superfamily)